MNEIEETGGAKVGMIRMTWPFAKLIVNSNKLILNCSIAGTFIFKPSDIISIVPGNYVFKTGIKINHNVSNYYSTIVFTTTESGNDLIKRIEQTGFLDNSPAGYNYDENEISEMQKDGAFPLKISAAISIVVIWNLLFLCDQFNVFGKVKNNIPLGTGAWTALIFMFLTALSLLVFEPARQLIMKRGRSVDTIKFFLFFLMFITGFMLVGLFSIS